MVREEVGRLHVDVGGSACPFGSWGQLLSKKKHGVAEFIGEFGFVVLLAREEMVAVGVKAWVGGAEAVRGEVEGKEGEAELTSDSDFKKRIGNAKMIEEPWLMEGVAGKSGKRRRE